MAWAFLLINIGVLLLSAYLRFGPEQLKFASPSPWPETIWVAAIAVTAAMAAILAMAKWRQLSQIAALKAIGQLMLVFPVFFAYEWLVLPPLMFPPAQKAIGAMTPLAWRPIDWAVTGGLVLLVAALIFLDRRNWRTWGFAPGCFLPACRLLAIPTAILVAAPIVSGLAIGARLDPDFHVEPSRLLVSLLAYPFYALAQLLIFQVFLVQRLKRITPSRVPVVLVSAGMFALAHWPNGLLMACTGVAAVLWTWVYLARPIYALALSMGLAATAFSNFLPRSFTHNLRTGPIYVERCIENERDARAGMNSPTQAAGSTQTTGERP